MRSVQVPRTIATSGKKPFNPRAQGYLMGDSLLRRDLLVWHIVVAGDLVCRCPSLVEMGAEPEEEVLALLGNVVTAGDPEVLLGAVVERWVLVKL